MALLDPTELHRSTLTRHDKRATHLRGFLLGRGFLLAAGAMDYAAGFHRGLRKDGVTPEFAHQVCIVGYLATLLPHLAHPEETLAAGFLHDVPEDYPVSFEEIDGRFGALVGDAVRPLTKEYQGVKRDPAEVLDAQAANPISSIVKAADRIHNQQTMAGVFGPTKTLSYVQETREEILPMIKKARRNFPAQDLAYQNATTVLSAQIELIKTALAGIVPSEEPARRTA